MLTSVKFYLANRPLIRNLQNFNTANDLQQYVYYYCFLIYNKDNEHISGIVGAVAKSLAISTRSASWFFKDPMATSMCHTTTLCYT